MCRLMEDQSNVLETRKSSAVLHSAMSSRAIWRNQMNWLDDIKLISDIDKNNVGGVKAAELIL